MTARPTRPMPRPLRTAVGASVVASVVVTTLGLTPGTAAADVTVAASLAEAGARDVTITFRVTNADPAVPTTRLQVFLPTVRPLVGVAPTAPSGWTARVDTAAPAGAAPEGAAPIPTAVTWEGGTVPGTEYAVFPVDVDRLPDGAGPLRFHVVQTFASGATEEWSDLVPYGAPAPAHPALVVPYGSTVPVAPAAPADPAGHHHGAADLTGVAAVAGEGATGRLVALVAAIAGLVGVATTTLGRRQRRRLAALRGAPERGPLGRE